MKRPKFARRRPPTLTSRARGTYRDDHQTPDWVLDIHRKIFGSHIDLDLASSDEANNRIQAVRYYTRDRPCPLDPVVWGGNVVWCNPPGPCKSVMRFWDAWCYCLSHGARGSFLAFSVDHLRLLRNPGFILWVGLLHRRVAYVGQTQTLAVGSALICGGIKLPENLDVSLAEWLLWQGAPR
jgi:hypothetical protein